jgi:hypothetical protein
VRRRRPARLIGAGTNKAERAAPATAADAGSPSSSPRRLLRRLNVKSADAHRTVALGEVATAARAAARRARIAFMVEA